MTSWVIDWPTWLIVRILGLACYGFLFAGTAAGIMHSISLRNRMSGKTLFIIHRWSNGIGLSLALLHALLLIADTYSPFRWREILVPFTSVQHPFLNGLGILAVYALLLILLTTDLRGRIGRRVWHMFHLLAYPVFIASLLHGIGVGTDTSLPYIRAVYWGTALAIAGLTFWRMGIGGERRHADASRGR